MSGLSDPFYVQQVMAWVAFDRGARFARESGLEGAPQSQSQGASRAARSPGRAGYGGCVNGLSRQTRTASTKEVTA